MPLQSWIPIPRLQEEQYLADVQRHILHLAFMRHIAYNDSYRHFYLAGKFFWMHCIRFRTRDRLVEAYTKSYVRYSRLLSELFKTVKWPWIWSSEWNLLFNSNLKNSSTQYKLSSPIYCLDSCWDNLPAQSPKIWIKNQSRLKGHNPS